ncbi:MAG: TolC family protein [Candidatus Krumholzibacteria bacterium]|nr:TolC family protein [Candidatus Krumholzibacteria bacterium]
MRTRVSLFLALLLIGITAAQSRTLSLEECVRRGREASPSLKSSSQSLDLSRENLLASWGSFLPVFNSSVSYSSSTRGPSSAREWTDPLSGVSYETEPSSGSNTESYSFGLSGSLTLFSGFGGIAGLEAAKLQVQASRNDLLVARNAVDREVTTAYYELHKAQMLETLAARSLELSQESFDQVKRAYTMGAVARSDTLSASVDLAESRLGLLTAENSLALSRISLATLLEIVPDSDLRVEQLDFDTYPLLPRDEILASALKSNPELLSARFQQEAALASLRQARSSLWPSLVGSYSYSWGDEVWPAEPLGIFEENYGSSYSLSLRWNLFSGFATRRAIASARVSERVRQYSRDLQERNLIKALESLLLTLENSRKRVELARATRELAREELRLARERYRVGAATLLEVSSAEVSVTRARSQEIDGMTAYLIALSELNRSAGISGAIHD